jgi:hypothetical protein
MVANTILKKARIGKFLFEQSTEIAARRSNQME